MRNTTRVIGNAISRVLNTIGMLIVAVIVVFIALTWLGANPDNAAATFVRELAQFFNLGLSNLFLIPDPRWSIALNYGVAALVWLVITLVVVRLVRRIG